MLVSVLVSACLAFSGVGRRVQLDSAAAFNPHGLGARSSKARSSFVRRFYPARRSPAINMNAQAEPKVFGRILEKVLGPRSVGSKTAEELKQNFLEFEPYYDKSKMPDNTFKPKSPYEGKIISVERIVGPDAYGETCDVIIEHSGNMPYIEGQSYGVIPPGISPKTGKPNKVRLYSIASSRYGDDMTGKTTTLCVKRAEYWDPETGKPDPAKKGVCSNYLCDAQCGDVVKLTGPSGKVMLLPEDKPETDIIMLATGTGIAPFRSFLKRMFVEDTPYARDFKGLAWLFLGVYNTDSILYDEEWKAIKNKYPDQFRYDLALSNEMKNKEGGPMYVQNRVEEYADEIFERLANGAHMYLCGLRGMLPGVQELLQKVAKEKGLDYDEFMSKLKKNGQWHVEVY